MSVGNIDWNDAMWGSPAAAPTSGNDYATKQLEPGADPFDADNRFRVDAAGDGGSSLHALGANDVNSGGTLTVIPEPGTLLMLALMAPLLVLRLRRRRA